MGLALRALGRGKKVCCAQFLKGEESGEITALRTFDGFTYIEHPKEIKFVFQMNEQEKEACRGLCESMLEAAAAQAESCELLILDEICAALSLGMVKEEKLLALLDRRPAGTDIVLTGRDPAASVLSRADYVSRICCVRHPFEQGVAAREGIEY